MFDQKRISQERVIGISFVDILIQVVFVLLVMLFVGYIDPVKQLESTAYNQLGKDLCHKLNKDSVEACREYLGNFRVSGPIEKPVGFGEVGQRICDALGAKGPEECLQISDKQISRLRPCVKPISDFSVPPTLSIIIRSPSEMQFIGIGRLYIRKLEQDNDDERLAKVAELEKLKGQVFNPQTAYSIFEFIREASCYHVISSPRTGPFSDEDLREALGTISKLRQPI